MFIYLFGLPAAGKNYVGQVLAEDFGFTFYDGDIDLTQEMRDAVRDQIPFTDGMRDRYYARLTDRIEELRQTAPDLAFGQATFKERHRRQIAASFPDVVFVLVQADEVVRMARLRESNSAVTVEYARLIASFFEPPKHAHIVIENNDRREAVVSQLASWLTRQSPNINSE
ncbi:MAG: shikimate kinase [Chloroflexota bacterium]